MAEYAFFPHSPQPWKTEQLGEEGGSVPLLIPYQHFRLVHRFSFLLLFLLMSF
jgi:hypothetical protein